MIGTRPLACGSSGCGWLTSQKPTSAGRRNQAKRGRGRSPRMSAAAGDRDERLHLLDHDRRDEVAVEERLGEEDRGDADAPAPIATAARMYRGPAFTTARGAGRRSGSDEQHEDDVLPEDDRRRGGRPAERLADDRVRAPHRRRDGDEHDSGSDGKQALHGCQPTGGTSCCTSSSVVSLRRIRRASPSRHEDDRRPRDAVVGRAHRERVRAGRRHREHVAAARLRAARRRRSGRRPIRSACRRSGRRRPRARPARFASSAS